MGPSPSIKSMLRGLPSLKGPFRDCDLNTLPNNPQAAFSIWLQDAISQGVKEPHAMTLSTVDADGAPDARVLILKNVDARGWHFAIKGDSPKGLQITNGSSKVALTFYWSDLGRQVRIRGKAIEVPATESAADFLERPAGSKITALASKQSHAMDDANDLDEGIAKARTLLEERPDYVSPTWKVFAVAPDQVEFWQGATDRLHKRLRFERQVDSDGWVRHTLYP